MRHERFLYSHHSHPSEVLMALFDLCSTLGRSPSHVKDPCFDPGLSRSATQRTSAEIHPSISGDTDTSTSTRCLNPSVSLPGGLTTTLRRQTTRSLPSYLQIREEPAVISIRTFGDCCTAVSPRRQPDPLKSSFSTGFFLASCIVQHRSDIELCLQLATGSKIWHSSGE